MKRAVILFAVALAAVTLIAATAGASRHDASKKKPPSAVVIEGAEAATGMSDCMSFSANHASKGHAADMAEFEKQFGKPTGGKAPVHQFSYDPYTTVVLDCSKRLCSVRCLSK